MTTTVRIQQLCFVGATLLSCFANGFLPSSRRSDALTRPSSHLASDRAHFERKFEDMMDNDWRAFRAKLVAQESSPAGIPTASRTTAVDKSLQRQSQLSDIFSKSIISIFDNTKQHQAQQHHHQEQQQHHHQEQQKAAAGRRRMLYKDAVMSRGATQQHRSSSGETTAAAPENIQLQSYEDPFVSAAELPLFIRETKINKHRWAHEIPHVEPGCVLIANEKLGGVFHQTVVLIIQHCERSGSIGIVINRPFEGDLLKTATEKQSSLDLSLKLAFSKAPVTYGGPVLPEEYSILHGFGPVEGATKLCPGVYVGGSEALMNEVRINRMDPRKALFVQGHAAWVPGQLSKEISKGVWYTAAASSDFLLRYAGAQITEEDNPKDLWADILSCMGGRYAEVSRMNQGQGDMRMP